MATCKSCQLSINVSESLKCNGVCEEYFHPVVKCSNIKGEMAKQIIKKSFPNLHYVCDDCSGGKIFHVLKAVEICNEGVKDFDSKLEEISNFCKKNSNRVTNLENTLADVNTESYSVDASHYDDLIKKLDTMILEFNMKLNESENRVKLDIKNGKDKSHVTCTAVNEFKEFSKDLKNLDQLINKMVKDQEYLNEEILQLNSRLVDLETKNKTYQSKSLFDELADTINFELIDDEAMSFSANGLHGVNEEMNPNSLNMISTEEPENDRVPVDGFGDYELVNRGDFFELYHKGVGPYRVNPEISVRSSKREMSPIYVASGDKSFDMNFLSGFLQDKFHLSNLQINQLSMSKNATYRSFRINVPSEAVDNVLQLRNWPQNVYVRRFDVSKKENFQIANWKDRKLRNRVVWNPTRLQ